MNLWLAQVGSEGAAKVITDSLQLSSGISRAWDELWQTLLLNPGELSLWGAIVFLALQISVFALIWFALHHGNEILNTQSWGKIIQMFVTPLVVVFLLGGNGNNLARLILLFRGFARDQIAQVLSLQIAGIALDRGIVEVNSNMYATQRVRQVFQECAALSGKDLQNCITAKQPEAQAIIDALGAETPVRAAQGFLQAIGGFITGSPIAETPLVKVTDGGYIQSNFTQVIQDPLIPIIQGILYAIQWAFVNLLEAALVLTALFAPIAVALMLLPVAGNALSAWMTGFVGIFGIQLGYNILVGLVATVLILTDRQNAIGAAGNFGFLLFISIFSPFLAVLIGGGGGVALYEGISRKAVQFGQGALQVVSTGVQMAVLRR